MARTVVYVRNDSVPEDGEDLAIYVYSDKLVLRNEYICPPGHSVEIRLASGWTFAITGNDDDE